MTKLNATLRCVLQRLKDRENWPASPWMLRATTHLTINQVKRALTRLRELGLAAQLEGVGEDC